VDTREAEKCQAFQAVITGKLLEPMSIGPIYEEFKTKLFDPICRHEGEEVAAVAAETPYQAWDAIKAIKVKV